MTTNQTAPVTDEELDQMIWKLERDGGMTPKQLSLMRELREVRKAKAPTAPDEQSFWDWLRDEMPTTYRWSRELEDTPENSALITKGKASALDMLGAWKGCSAAMLQLSGNSEQLEHVSNRDELNSPATTDGWIPVSERMPEKSGRYWCYVEEQNDLGKSHYEWNCSWNGERWLVESENGGKVTHWQPLSAAPKEVG